MPFPTQLPHPTRTWLHNGAFLNHSLKPVSSDSSPKFCNCSAPTFMFPVFLEVNSQLFFLIKTFLDVELIIKLDLF